MKNQKSKISKPERPLSLCGCGALAVEIIEAYLVIADLNKTSAFVKYIVDEKHDKGYLKQIDNLLDHFNIKERPILCSSLKEVESESSDFIIAIGSCPMLRDKVYGELVQRGLTLKTIVHPSSYVSPGAKLGEGIFINQSCIIGYGTFISANVFINNFSIVAHGSTVGQSTIISPGAKLSGDVVIEEMCSISTGAVIDRGSRLRKKSVVSALAFYSRKNGKEKGLYIGNPARECSKSQ